MEEGQWRRDGAGGTVQEGWWRRDVGGGHHGAAQALVPHLTALAKSLFIDDEVEAEIVLHVAVVALEDVERIEKLTSGARD